MNFGVTHINTAPILPNGCLDFLLRGKYYIIKELPVVVVVVVSLLGAWSEQYRGIILWFSVPVKTVAST